MNNKVNSNVSIVKAYCTSNVLSIVYADRYLEQFEYEFRIYIVDNVISLRLLYFVTRVPITLLSLTVV